MPRLLLIAALFLAALNTSFQAMDLRAAVYVTKPLATLALAILVMRGAPASRYRAWIAAGLIASLAGDVLLMLPMNLFLPGLVAFLVAHLCYIAAFAADGGGWRVPKLAAVLVYGVAAVVLAFLWPSLGAMRVPVTGYVTIIATMAWQAIIRWQGRRSTATALAAAGSVCFLVSDSALAFNRFVEPYAGAALVIMVTYYAAQWGITLSVSDPAAK
ncbi:MAG: lysoplasmalogenase [Gemmatimonadetes bacterium]|nr:lysoplasmalogenase [Gemmatimonadota bacterium]